MLVNVMVQFANPMMSMKSSRNRYER